MTRIARIKRCISAGFLGAAVSPLALSAHGAGAGAESHPWTSGWHADPLILPSLLLLSVLYLLGWLRARKLRGALVPVRPAQVGAFWTGMACLFLALLSPIDRLADDLQWMHMVQHMVLMNLAAPLVVMGAPIRIMLWAFPPRHRARFGRWRSALDGRPVPRYLFWQPAVLLCLYAAVLWAWHLPRFYEAAMASEPLHHVQHVMFFSASCLFWRVLFDPIGRLRLSRAAAVLYLFVTSLHATVLGVFMALSPALWYGAYAETPQVWGLSPLADQQLAGYIMWMPACMMYALVAAVVFARWLQANDGHLAAGRAAGP